MNRKLTAILALVLCLGACTNKEGTRSSSTNQSTVTSSKPTKTSTSTTDSQSNQISSQEVTTDTQVSSSQEEEQLGQTATTPSQTNATFNGSYYFVQGKYGPVLIVNKKHPLASTYAPGEIPEAQAAFYQLKADMQAKGFAISDQYSGYRSYSHQAGLYQSYVNQDGQAAADTYSARPGYSEHQTGLAYDFIDSSGNLLEEPVASQWLRENAHHYGFIVRYLSGKEAITGYMAESWHIRYIGKEATDIYHSGLTLEEYFGVPGGDYE